MKSKRLLVACAAALLGVAVATAKDMRTVVFKVEQMECQNCEKKVKNNIKFEKGLKDMTTDVANHTVTITYDADKTTVEKLKQSFQSKLKYEAEVLSEGKADAGKSKQK